MSSENISEQAAETKTFYKNRLDFQVRFLQLHGILTENMSPDDIAVFQAWSQALSDIIDDPANVKIHNLIMAGTPEAYTEASQLVSELIDTRNFPKGTALAA